MHHNQNLNPFPDNEDSPKDHDPTSFVVNKKMGTSLYGRHSTENWWHVDSQT